MAALATRAGRGLTPAAANPLSRPSVVPALSVPAALLPPLQCSTRRRRHVQPVQALPLGGLLTTVVLAGAAAWLISQPESPQEEVGEAAPGARAEALSPACVRSGATGTSPVAARAQGAGTCDAGVVVVEVVLCVNL
eukprot:CAMPEP_0119107086 /NCGR_PEP_ID=MMETSP1180-20130426/7940_1 /TAXON_ID=3052 ORGANISM="Chlamydomonas cf sp, Strain CCMP681" /NCGR_SAMPLE_ID=MMETSP1180 /ASSEMBLY_ACC=CAM_ASM_000741 /LENGTH=136 /DNA_ID=CAMNT_0007092519 /DNA_START=114 /DNA_END=525 /DNA_ORIENTATION=-